MIFKDHAQLYSEKQFSILPISQNTKAPFLTDWSRYCRELPKGEEIQTWSKKYGKSNIGLCCGVASGVVGLDLDLDLEDPWQAEIYQKIKALIPDSPVEKKGAKGSTRFFKFDGEVSESIKLGAVTIVELLSTGRQTVLPPSIHPLTGKPYRWLSQKEILDVDKNSLPLLPRNTMPAIRKIIASIHGSVDSKSESRHERLKKLIFALFHKKGTDDEIVKEVIHYDQKFFKHSYLADPSEKDMRHGSIEANACWLVSSMKRSFDRINRNSDSEISSAAVPLIKVRPKEPAEAAYHGILGEIVELLKPHTEADPIGILAQLIVTFGNMIGNKCFVRVDGTKHHANLFLSIVGRSSKSRKGTSLSHVENVVKIVDRNWFTTKKKSGLSSGEGLIWEVRDGDGDKDAGVKDKRLLVVEPEFAQILRMLEREGNTLSAVLRNAWDSRNLAILSRASKAIATKPHLSIVGHITEEELNKLLRENEKANGFGNRFIWVCVERKRLLPTGGDAHSINWEPFIKRFTSVLEFANQGGEVKIAKGEALDYWVSIYESYAEERTGLFGAMIARAETQILRLALIFAVLDKSSEILISHLNAAESFWKYCEDSCFYLFGSISTNPIANNLLNAISSSENGLTRTEIRDLFNRNKTRDEIQQALDELIHTGKVEKIVEKSSGVKSIERFTLKSPEPTQGGDK